MSDTSLTERYVSEIVRRIPANLRHDVADELRGTIADTIDAREPTDRQQAEREILTEMGDPISLSAQFADRPQMLIGPGLYPTYIRLLTILLCTVLPVFTVLMVAMDVLDGAGAAAILGTALWAIVGAGAQIIAWSTLIFALLERYRPGARGAGRAENWSVDDLAEVPERDTGGAGAWAAVVAHIVFFGLIVWQHLARPFRTETGEQIAILDPALWSGWIWPALTGLLGAAVVQVLRIAARGWTRRLVTAYVVIDVLIAVPFIWVLYQQILFNPALLAEVNQDWTTPDEIYTGAAVIVAIAALSGTISRFRQVRR